MFGTTGNQPLIMGNNNDEDNYDGINESQQSSGQPSMGGRSVSLLERIQQQRQRELEAAQDSAMAVTTQQGVIGTAGIKTGNEAMLSIPSQQQQQQQVPSQQIHVPQYGPMPGFGNNGITMQTQQPEPTPTMSLQQQQGRKGYLNNAWNNFTQNMESSMMAEKSQLNMSSPQQQPNGNEMHQALLPPSNDYNNNSTMMNYGSHNNYDDNYSISQYFLTFVKDVYGLFIWLPIVVRVIVVVGLVYAVMKLL
jgi:hypothetical protein